MKILLCERTLVGHRKTYMEYLLSIKNVEFFCFAPENVGVPEDHYFQYSSNLPMKSMRNYYRWIKQIRLLVKKHDIDLVHIPDGDSIRRFFGFGFSLFGVKTVLTYHHYFKGKVSRLSYRAMSGNGKRVCVVHTESVKTALEDIGLKNVRKVEYPAFSFDKMAALCPEDSKQKLGITSSGAVIGIIGGITGYKRIIPFLQTLSKCKRDFHLLICGKPQDITESEIDEAIKEYRDKVTLQLKRLTDEEYDIAISASDVIYNMYGLEFDGASGPLTDGVCAEKMILASSHGSLGQIVKENHLGITCNCMDENAVLYATEQAIDNVIEFRYDKVAIAYRESLRPQLFLEKYLCIYID